MTMPTRPSSVHSLFVPVFAVVLFLAAMAPAVHAQVEIVPAPEARPSPMALAATTIGDTYIKVVYGSPRKRDRDIFGGLVPFGETWRTGANEATEIIFTGDVMMGDALVEAGTYSLFTIPGEKEWTLLLNSGLGQWGDFSHDPEKDVHSITVPARQTNTMHEAFTVSFRENGSGHEMVMAWDRTEVVVPVMVH